ncbi:hypothetical protein IWQ60_012479, partial [Tieghemiomyces parasiticus]
VPRITTTTWSRNPPGHTATTRGAMPTFGGSRCSWPPACPRPASPLRCSLRRRPWPPSSAANSSRTSSSDRRWIRQPA